MIGDIIDGKKPDADFERLTRLGQECSRLEQRAESAERELKKLKLLNYFSERIGTEMEAVVTGVEPFGLFAQGVQIPAEGLLPIANLPDDHYQFDRAARTLNGYHGNNQFRLGDLIRVIVSHVDTNRRQLEFQLLEKEKSGGSRKRKSRHRRQDSSDASAKSRKSRKHK